MIRFCVFWHRGGESCRHFRDLQKSIVILSNEAAWTRNVTLLMKTLPLEKMLIWRLIFWLWGGRGCIDASEISRNPSLFCQTEPLFCNTCRPHRCRPISRPLKLVQRKYLEEASSDCMGGKLGSAARAVWSALKVSTRVMDTQIVTQGPPQGSSTGVLHRGP